MSTEFELPTVKIEIRCECDEILEVMSNSYYGYSQSFIERQVITKKHKCKE